MHNANFKGRRLKATDLLGGLSHKKKKTPEEMYKVFRQFTESRK